MTKFAKKGCLAVVNQKGGVGKTTTSVNLAAALAELNNKVLLIDLDPQGNTTMGCGINKYELSCSVCEVLMGEKSAIDAIVTSGSEKFDVLPANTDLTAAEIALVAMEDKEYQLRNALQKNQLTYDYIIIDCPPSLNMLTINALAIVEGVLIPMQCEYYALEGLSALLDTIKRVREQINPTLKIEGLLRTMFDVRNNLSNEVSGQLISHFGEKVYRTIVPRNITVAEAPSHGKPVIEYDRNSRGAIAYLGLAGELIRRTKFPSKPMNNSGVA